MRRRGPTLGLSRRCCLISRKFTATRPASRIASAGRPARRSSAPGEQVAARDRSRAQGDRLHVGGDRIEQPGDQGRGPGVEAERQPPGDLRGRAQGGARHDEAAGTRGLGGDRRALRRDRPGRGRVDRGRALRRARSWSRSWRPTTRSARSIRSGKSAGSAMTAA